MKTIIDFCARNFLILQLLFCYLAYLPLLKPRKFFWLRAGGGVIVCILCSEFMAHFMDSENVILHGFLLMLKCALHIALTIGVLKISFEDNIWTLIMCGISAYTTQHIAYRLGITVEIFLRRGDMSYAWLNFIIEWLSLVVVVFLCYFLLTRRFKKKTKFKINRNKVIFWIILIFVVTVTLNIKMSAMFTADLVVVIELNAYAFLACETLLFCLFNGAYTQTLGEEVETIQLLWKKDRLQYEISKQNVELLNMKFHDLKHYINSNIRLDDEKTSAEISKCLEMYDSVYHTGNEALDVILAERKILCDNSGIGFTCIADGKLLNMMNTGDIYSLLGNALDNAIECQQKVKEKELRNIKILINHVNEMVKITVENYVPERPDMVNGIPKTTKDDVQNHGYGIKSMQYIVNKYNGIMELGVVEDIFHVDILIPL